MNMRVTVVVRNVEWRFDHDLGEAILSELRGMGVEARLVDDRRLEGLDAEVVLATIGLSHLQNLLRRLSRGRVKAGRIVFWQVDPLLPDGLGKEEENRLLELAESGWRKSRWWGWPVVSENAREARVLRRYLRATKPAWEAAAERVSANASVGWPEADWDLLRRVSERCWALKRAVEGGWVDEIFVSTMRSWEYLSRRGIRSTFATVGVYPGCGREMGLERDIDATFLGYATYKHRGRMLDYLKREVEGRGLKWNAAVGSSWGEARTELLNRTKLLVHLHRYPWDTPWMRFYMGMTCGAMMLSEELSDPRPFEPGVHYVEGKTEELPGLIERYAKDEGARRGIVDNARKFIQKLTMKQSLSRILGMGAG